MDECIFMMRAEVHKWNKDCYETAGVLGKSTSLGLNNLLQVDIQICIKRINILDTINDLS